MWFALRTSSPPRELKLPQTDIDAQTLEAYRQTLYRVLGRRGFVLRVGERSRRLAELIAEHGSGAAFITAFNPFSIELSEKENHIRHEALREVVISMRLLFLEGCGQHPSGDWPTEDSILVLGVTVAQARGIAAQFGQNALVWVGTNAVPDLILLR